MTNEEQEYKDQAEATLDRLRDFTSSQVELNQGIFTDKSFVNISAIIHTKYNGDDVVCEVSLLLRNNILRTSLSVPGIGEDVAYIDMTSSFAQKTVNQIFAEVPKFMATTLLPLPSNVKINKVDNGQEAFEALATAFYAIDEDK